MRRNPLRANTVSGITLALAAVAFAPPSPVQAASGPTFTSSPCGDTSHVATCTISWSGGTAPFTVAWSSIGAPPSSSGGTFTGVTSYSINAGGEYVPQTFYEVKVTVTDAAGLSATTYAGGRCN